MTQIETNITMNEWLSRFKQDSCHQIFENLDEDEDKEETQFNLKKSKKIKKKNAK